MSIIMIRNGRTTIEYNVPYSIARAIEVLLNSTNCPNAEIDNDYYDEESEKNERKQSH